MQRFMVRLLLSSNCWPRQSHTGGPASTIKLVHLLHVLVPKDSAVAELLAALRSSFMLFFAIQANKEVLQAVPLSLIAQSRLTMMLDEAGIPWTLD